ncbi:SRPBCC family protein [Cellulomonas sp. DKR-3]|uniref:SRPBCC family protein n=1 Tax=Cellulomonas fulva TaxID=2835530 RepID=A0ABS5U1I2_9CELL|nr:SRPBCC family protein [Cellulomonas fulva]MBT0995267.1 SRPBCC family protein [Cellulomonas fulva]
MWTPSRRQSGLLLLAGAVALLPVARTWGLQWGASEDELDASLAGDDVVRTPGLVATRAITVDAPADQVWAWLVQLGQGRGGFYSYDWLENLVGLRIHSADRVEDRWQDLAEGDEIHLAPAAALVVTVLDPPRAMVLTAPDASFTWAFTLHPGRDRATRLVVRERYARPRWWAVPLNEAVGAVSTVMSRRMLLGIRDRAEAAALRP